MDGEREIGAENASAKRLQLISDAVNEYEGALASQHPVAETPMLDLFLVEHPSRRLEKAKDLLKRMNIPLVLQHHEWFEQVDQPAGEQEDHVVSIYEFVKKKLDHWTGVRKDKEHQQPACDKTAPTDKLIVWSAELWFFQQLEGIEDEDITAWISREGTEALFKKYFHPINEDEPRFTAVTEKDACELLRQLLKIGKVDIHLKELLNDWRNIRDLIMGSAMSKEMANIYSKSSERFYVIPPPTDKWKMYGMHFYLANHFKKDEARIVPSIDSKRLVKVEAKCMRQAILRCNFKLRGPHLSEFNPEDGTFKQLESWLPQKLLRIRKKCSMLFISFSLHGKQGHIMDTLNEFRKIEWLLRLINDNPDLRELKEVPKVVVIQACQHIPDDEKDRNDEFEAISDRLESFVRNEARNMVLLMPVKQGESYRLCDRKSYLFRFSEGMNSTRTLDPPTVSEVDRISLKRDAKGTKIKSNDCKETLFQASAAVRPAGERAHGGSDSDDDGYELLSNSETEDEESEDEDEPVDDNTDY